MRRVNAFLVVVFLVVSPPGAAQVGQEDLLSVLIAQPGLAERLGVAKLTAEERAAWNEVLNMVLQAGSQMPALPPSPSGVGATGADVQVYESTVDEADGDVVQLSNGAVVEVTGYLGYVGYRRDGILIKQGRSWRIWIEGKRTFTARVLREPSRGGRSGEVVSVSEVLGNGAILRLADGRMLEVDSIDQIYTGIWLPYFDAILVGGYELLNLDSGEKISVRAIG